MRYYVNQQGAKQSTHVIYRCWIEWQPAEQNWILIKVLYEQTRELTHDFLDYV